MLTNKMKQCGTNELATFYCTLCREVCGKGKKTLTVAWVSIFTDWAWSSGAVACTLHEALGLV